MGDGKGAVKAAHGCTTGLGGSLSRGKSLNPQGGRRPCRVKMTGASLSRYNNMGRSEDTPDRSSGLVEIAGRATGILVFLAGVVLLGLVFTYTVRTIDSAEQAIRQGHLTLQPLFGTDMPESRYQYGSPGSLSAERPTYASPRHQRQSSELGTESADPDADKGLSPLVVFGMALGARIIGLCVLGFLAGIIATQGARMAGASRSLHGRDSIE